MTAHNAVIVPIGSKKRGLGEAITCEKRIALLGNARLRGQVE